MKLVKTINIELNRKGFPREIDAVQYDTGLQLKFIVKDFEIPAGTTATLYAEKPSGKFVYQETGITISDNTVIIELENQTITEHGKVWFQITLKNGTDTISTFEMLVKVQKSRKDSGAVESITVIRAFDEAVEKAVEQINAARDAASKYISESVDPSLSISGKAADAAAVGKEFGKLSGEIDNLEPENLYLVRTSTQPCNFINKYYLIPYKYIDYDGVEHVDTSETFYLTDYIKVNPLDMLYSYNVGLSCFYDSTKTFISSHENFNEGVEVPKNAMYMRCSIPVTLIDIAYVGALNFTNDNGMIVLSKNKQYENDWIKFTVPVNQTIVSTNDIGDTLSDSQNYVDVECVLRLPPTYTPYGTPSKLLMLCHGAGRGVTYPNSEDGKAWIDIDSYNYLVETFISNGYAVFDCNGYNNTAEGCNFWGAPKGVEAWKKAYDYVTDNYNVETTFSIFGFSMGGLTACHLVMNGFPNIKCVALASPVLDLKKCWEDGQTALMELGYGMTGVYDESKALGSNPMSHLVTIGDKEYCLPKMPPIKVWYGSIEEGVAVNKNYAIRLVNAMKNSGSYAIYREWQGAGHEICYGENTMAVLEYYLWINRFNDNYYN